MAKRSCKGPKAVLDIPVEFGGVGIGQSTCRLGVKISRNSLNIVAADEAFCGHRLSGKVILGQRDDAEGQEKMFDSDYQVEGSFDVKRIGVDADTIVTGLTFSLADIDVADLAKFSKGAGRLVVDDIGELPVDAPNEHDEDRADDEPPSTLRAEGPWRDVPLKDLFSGSLLASLVEASLRTVGDLSDYTASEKRLTDLAGVGPGKAEKIENTMLGFWKSNPQYCNGAEG